MIDRGEILEAASSFSLLPNVVEKDYILGWILAGINAHEGLAESWIFKGGTCLKKCYFETYRFSEDLDFTLRNEEHLDEKFLQTVFEEVIAWVTEQSGLNIPADQLELGLSARTPVWRCALREYAAVLECRARIVSGGLVRPLPHSDARQETS